jgi:hypothetical protein
MNEELVMQVQPVRGHTVLRGEDGTSFGAVAFRLFSLLAYAACAVVGPQLGIALARLVVG